MSESIETLVRKVLSEMNDKKPANSVIEPNDSSNKNRYEDATKADYPIASKHPDWVKTPTGKSFNDLTLQGVMDGTVVAEDVRISADILKAQGAIASDAGRPAIKKNFDRAAELVSVPDDMIFEIYNALRPYRSTKEELNQIANRLENDYNAKINAKFIREAAGLYEKRKKLKGDN